LQRYYLNTRRLGIFKPYPDFFYTPNIVISNAWIKKVPFNIEEYLSFTAFAYWFMDDGDQK
jgi:hypothetical protein